jgi:hypothetical protein
MRSSRSRPLLSSLMFTALLLHACGAPAPSPTTPPATRAATSVPPAATLGPPTATPVPPTATPVPPTATAVPPTATPSAERRLEVARAALDGRNFPQALALLNGLKQSDPNLPELDEALYEAHLGFGRVLLEEGRLDHSYGEFGEALKLKPNDPAGLDGQKQVVLVKNWNKMEAEWSRNPEAAITALEEIVQHDAGYREAREKLFSLLIGKADRLVRMGDIRAALPVLRRATEVSPDRGEARQRLGRLPTPGATYAGRTTTGAPVSITVNAAGTGVQALTFGSQGGGTPIVQSPCGWFATWLQGDQATLPIVDGGFSDRSRLTVSGLAGVSEFVVVTHGRFSDGRLAGTIAATVPDNSRCNTAEVSWSTTPR